MQNSRVIVRRLAVPIRGASPEWSGTRFAHVSDFHFRRWNGIYTAAQEVLSALDFDFLVATGDFCNAPHKWARSAELIRRFFGPLAERCPVYAVLGNHDHPALAEDVSLPVTFLRNQSVEVTHHGAAFRIAGVDQTQYTTEDLPGALGDPEGAGPTILLAHYPSTVFRLPSGRVDLQLSGHTHGGQIRLPYLGCVWTNDGIPCRIARGLHLAAGTLIHVSPGIGVSQPIPWRFNCPPEVTVLNLAPADCDTPGKAVRMEATSAAIG